MAGKVYVRMTRHGHVVSVLSEEVEQKKKEGFFLIGWDMDKMRDRFPIPLGREKWQIQQQATS